MTINRIADLLMHEQLITSGLHVVITDSNYRDASIERAVLEPAGIQVHGSQCKTEDEVIEFGRDADGLLVQYAPITERVIRELKKLKVIARYGVGLDNIDLRAAETSSIQVRNVPDYGSEEVASHALALLLALWRGLPQFHAAVQAGSWDYRVAGVLHRPSESVLGLVGFGAIARSLATKAQKLFGILQAHDPHVTWEGQFPSVKPRGLAELFESSHLISIHLPLTDETRGLIDRNLLERMPTGSVVVNTSRGEVLDEADLLWALDEGPVKAAGLDVMFSEPPQMGDSLVTHPRTLITPHAAWYSVTAERTVRERAARAVLEVLRPMTGSQRL